MGWIGSMLRVFYWTVLAFSLPLLALVTGVAGSYQKVHYLSPTATQDNKQRSAWRLCSGNMPALTRGLDPIIQRQQLHLGHFLDGVSQTFTSRSRVFHTTVRHVVDPVGRHIVDD